MKLQEFEAHLDRYGVDPQGWPPALRTLRESLLACSEPARRLLERHHRFDRLFPEQGIPAPPEAAWLAAQASAPVQERPAARWPGFLRRDWLEPRWAHAAGLAACVLLGFVLGLIEPSSHHAGFDPLDLVDGSGLEQIQ